MIEIDDIIMQIRGAASTADYFSSRVHGAAEYDILKQQEITDLAVPSAFVIPINDTAIDKSTAGSNTIRAEVTSNFVVAVIISNTADRTGLTAAQALHAIRAALWKALLNWPNNDPEVNPIRYRGGRILEMNRGRLVWGFNFSYAFEIAASDGFQPIYENLETIATDVDMISPNNGEGGPDGQIDAVFHATDLYPEDAPPPDEEE